MPHSASAPRSEQSLQEELLEEMFSPAPPEEEQPPVAEVSEQETTVPDAPASQAGSAEAAAQRTAADVAETETSSPAQSPPPEQTIAQRSRLEQRIAGSSRLPPAIRQHLAAALEQARWNSAGEEQPSLTVSQAVSMLETTLPRQFALAADDLEARAHPAGDIFFSGSQEAVSEARAAQLAAEQLAATGFAPR